jgi:hypothetical protein
VVGRGLRHARRQITRTKAQANAGANQSGAKQPTPIGAGLRSYCQNKRVLNDEGELPPDIVAAIAPALAGSDRWLARPGTRWGWATANDEASMNKFASLGKLTLHRSMK